LIYDFHFDSHFFTVFMLRLKLHRHLVSSSHYSLDVGMINERWQNMKYQCEWISIKPKL